MLTTQTTNYTLKDFTFVFLQGIRIRCGTNYLGKIASYHPDIQFLSGKTTDELPLLGTLSSHNSEFSNLRKYLINAGGEKSSFEFNTFAEYLGDASLRYLIDKFQLQPGHVFLKDPHVNDIDLFFDFFPRAKLIILIRDGRDNVVSSIKSGLSKRKNLSIRKKIKRQLNHWFLRDFTGNARDWARWARVIQEFEAKFRNTPRASQYMTIRYEDIYQKPRAMSQELFRFMGLDFDEEILSRIENAEVVGSSFYSADQREDASKPNWRPTPKTERFQPIGRWKRWGRFQKQIFKRVAGKELIAFGYETGMDW